MTSKCKKLDVPFNILASTPMLQLNMEEESGKDCYVEFFAYFNEEKKNMRVRLYFENCIAGKMLPFSREISYKVPIGEVIDSLWIREINELQKEYYPEFDDLSNVRHLYICGHDVVVEVLADNYVWQSMGEST